MVLSALHTLENPLTFGSGAKAYVQTNIAGFVPTGVATPDLTRHEGGNESDDWEGFSFGALSL
jgi:hypothetical protein